jgi:transcriptional regulator with XRE-family HTH domain
VVAARVGVSQQAYAGWERRTVAINPRYIAKLARALRTDLGELLREGAGPDPPEFPTGHTRTVFLKLASLPKREQDRIIQVVEDLISATKQR